MLIDDAASPVRSAASTTGQHVLSATRRAFATGRFARELFVLLETGGLQVAVSAVGFVAGIVAIRLLPIGEFAYYTVANAMLGTLSVLGDCGIAQGVLARGGKLWRDRAALSGTLSSGLLLRRRLGAAALVGALPLLYALLRQQGASTPIAILTSVSIVPSFLSVLSGHLFEVILRLHQNLRALQWIQLRGALIRLLIVAGAIAVFPYAWLAGICAGLGQIWATWRTRRLTRGIVDFAARPDPDATGALQSQMKRVAPGALYYAISGQINVWLISVFGGGPNAVAEAGALGRLSMVFGVASTILALLYVPRFARLQSRSRAHVQWVFWSVQVGLILLGTVLTFTVWVFPSAVLAVLGPSYSSLTHEVTLAVAGGAIGFTAASAYSFAAAHNIILAPTIAIPATAAVQVVLAALLPISTVAGVLWFGLLANAVLWLMYAMNFVHAKRAVQSAATAS
jgi:O-antigen/teichoic acid export membrane protein